MRPFGPSVFKPADLTLAQMLKAQGYRTACIGKWHLGWDWEADQESRCGGSGSKNRLFGRCVRLVEADSRRSARSWFRLLLWQRRAELSALHLDRKRSDRRAAADGAGFDPKGQRPKGAGTPGRGRCRKDWDFYAVVPRLTEKTVEWIGQQWIKRVRSFFMCR